jgi:hypothetical protein
MAEPVAMQYRYVVRFTGDGAGVRSFGEPLCVGAQIIERGYPYRVTQVEAPSGPAALGRVWVEPDILFTA